MSTKEIRAMLPGVFYRKSAPDQPNFKNAGDTVQVGDVIGLIEVMKSFHEVQSDVSGTITSFKINNEEAITPGTVIVEVAS